VIAKIHYRGRLKQRLVRLALPSDVPTLPPAAALYTHTTSASEAAHPVGQIIHHHQSDALAVVKTKIPDGAELLLQTNGASVGRVAVFETDAQDRDLVS
jgi:folate-binding Fe-S cluster repair protein YgfZ